MEHSALDTGVLVLPRTRSGSYAGPVAALQPAHAWRGASRLSRPLGSSTAGGESQGSVGPAPRHLGSARQPRGQPTAKSVHAPAGSSTSSHTQIPSGVLVSSRGE